MASGNHQNSESSLLRRLFPLRPGWLILWASLYLAIIIGGLLAPPFSLLMSFIRVGSIFSCFVYALLHSGKDHLLVVALFFTFCSDCILAVNNLSVAGVILFAVAQITHFIRLSRNTNYVRTYFFVILAILASMIFVPPEYSLIVCGSAYALTLLANVFLAWRWQRLKPSTASACALLGFVLFAACDLNVAASYGCVIGVLPFAVKGFADYIAWIFYLPSQVALAHTAQTVIK